ncbi:MAG: imidazole glycerol phosphate synthase subunit HisH, partial [Pseudomonadota bacterium]
MSEIRRLRCDELLFEALENRHKPVLGICVGMQALMSSSEENGGVDCLNTVEGVVRYFGKPLTDADGERLKVPHMGWNKVRQRVEHPLWRGIPDMTRFYFVHGYYVDAADRAQVAGSVEYGVEFDAALTRDNLFAVQFHPEKSHTAGLKLLKNFLGWDGQC